MKRGTIDILFAGGQPACPTMSDQSFRNFDEYWEVQTLPFSPPGKSVARLDAAQRERLRDHLRETLPIASDGSITYSATALAGKARRP
jgi:hypothetical protein